MSPKLLVIDDDASSCRLLRAIFAPEGFDVIAAHDGQSGLERVEVDCPDVVALDLRLPEMEGLEVLSRIKAEHDQVPVVVLTAHADVRSAVRATQLGAFNYLTKPVDREEVVLSVQRALEARAIQAELTRLRPPVGEASGLRAQMGESAQVTHIIEQVRLVADSTLTVLITGETGTGKELVAQAIHRQSSRSGKPFIALDCGAMPDTLLESELFGHEKGAFTGAERRREGRFQLAQGGTFFLDEIGNLPALLQAKLLRVLESRQVQAVGAPTARAVDVRFVAASNQDVHADAKAGRFRADLYFRLAQYTIQLPPLREREEDIPYLALRLLEEASIELRRPVQTFSPGAMGALRRHRWPGNVRELRNTVRRAVLQTGDLVVREDTVVGLLGTSPVEPSKAPPSEGSLRDIAQRAAREAESRAIIEALRSSGGNRSQAAKSLQIDYKTLRLKMKQLGIRAQDFAP